MTARFTRLTGLIGIFATVFTLTLIFVSVAISSWFDWHENALSDIGVSSTAALFNGTLLIGGALYLVFAIGLLRWRGTSSRMMKLAAFFLLAGASGLVLIGVFTEDAGDIHYIVAITYFIATPLAFMLLGIDMLKNSEPVPGVLSIMAGLGTLGLILFVPHQGWAVPEILAAVVIGAWTISFGVKLLFEARTTTQGTTSR